MLHKGLQFYVETGLVYNFRAIQYIVQLAEPLRVAIARGAFRESLLRGGRTRRVKVVFQKVLLKNLQLRLVLLYASLERCTLVTLLAVFLLHVVRPLHVERSGVVAQRLTRHGDLGKLGDDPGLVGHKGDALGRHQAELDNLAEAPELLGQDGLEVIHGIVLGVVGKNVTHKEALAVGHEAADAAHVVAVLGVTLAAEDVHSRIQEELVLHSGDAVHVVALRAHRAAAFREEKAAVLGTAVVQCVLGAGSGVASVALRVALVHGGHERSTAIHSVGALPGPLVVPDVVLLASLYVGVALELLDLLTRRARHQHLEVRALRLVWDGNGLLDHVLAERHRDAVNETLQL
ncbi:taste receptor type 1 member 1 isoform X2 [Babesia caballi]|uniref:Taste receptor type 1 member 1 isoform X2 n=1 Tax=Babesia caballi TaxID=5871 RepID=A0AAV4M357_BABCB|nr:taste receptor type 1 member 1 isoform X2 [Babesia caballi]